MLRLLNKPAGFYPRVSKRVPAGQIPAGIIIPAGIQFRHYPTRYLGITRLGKRGIPAGYPGIFLAGCSSSVELLFPPINIQPTQCRHRLVILGTKALQSKLRDRHTFIIITPIFF